MSAAGLLRQELCDCIPILCFVADRIVITFDLHHRNRPAPVVRDNSGMPHWYRCIPRPSEDEQGGGDTRSPVDRFEFVLQNQTCRNKRILLLHHTGQAVIRGYQHHSGSFFVCSQIGSHPGADSDRSAKAILISPCCLPWSGARLLGDRKTKSRHCWRLFGGCCGITGSW